VMIGLSIIGRISQTLRSPKAFRKTAHGSRTVNSPHLNPLVESILSFGILTVCNGRTTVIFGWFHSTILISSIGICSNEMHYHFSHSDRLFGDSNNHLETELHNFWSLWLWVWNWLWSSSKDWSQSRKSWAETENWIHIFVSYLIKEQVLKV
jgi:hypothetical protein